MNKKSSDERNYIDDTEWDALTDTYRPDNYYSDCLDMDPVDRHEEDDQ